MKNTNLGIKQDVSTQSNIGAPFNIVLDVDGVCLDFDAGFSVVAESVLGRKLSNNKEEYDLCKKYGITKEEHDFVWKEMENHYSGWTGLPLMKDADVAFKFFKDNGFKIHLVTGIEECISGLRLQNLRNHNMIADSITCVGHGTASKMNYIKELNPVLFVDDRLQHINEASFVKNRVWVDLSRDQFGLKKDDATIRVNSMNEWVEQYGQAFLEDLKNSKKLHVVKTPKKNGALKMA